ncbi:MAG: hypothetical protein IJA55_04745 [Clostridia bacterium]|nr:hypothetical protein [Clostridia bacterium]
MKRVLLLILAILCIIPLAACSSVPANADPDECYGYSFNIKIYDYYGDSYDNCDVTVTSAGGGRFKESYLPDAGICAISLSKGQYTLTVTDKESGKEWKEDITVIAEGKKSFLEIKTEFGYDHSKTAGLLLTEKREELISEYGLISNEPVYEKDVVDTSSDKQLKSEWLSKDGIIVVSYTDLDYDDNTELYLLRKEGNKLITQAFYVSGDEMNATEELSQELPEPNFGVCMNLRNYLIKTENGTNICTDMYYYTMYNADGFSLGLNAYRFSNGKLLPYMTLNGSGSAGVSYELVTYTGGAASEPETISVDAANEGQAPIPSALTGLGYPALEAEAAIKADGYLGGYGNACSYYDHTTAVKLCKLTTEYITSDHIQGNDSYVKCLITDNTDTHVLYGEISETEVKDPYELPACYKEIIDLLINGKTYWAVGSAESGGIPGLPEVGKLYANCKELSQVGYALIDIDNNGTDELFIGGGTEKFEIFDIYTAKDGKALHLISGAEGSKYMLNSDGTLYNTWSNGAYNSGESWYKMNPAGDGLAHTVSVFTDKAAAATEEKKDTEAKAEDSKAEDTKPETSGDAATVLYVANAADRSDKKTVTKEEGDAAKGKLGDKTIDYRTLEEYNKIV